LLLLITAPVAYWGPQFANYLRFQRLTSPPWWGETPRPLENEDVSKAPGTKLSYFGYQFEVPWSGIEKEWNDEEKVKIQFQTGQYIIFIVPAKSQNDLRTYAASKDTGDSLTARAPEVSSQSNYERLKLTLSMTPSLLRPFESRKNFNRDSQYLLDKGNSLEHSGATALFSIQSANYKGFEIDGGSYSGRVDLILFDAADHLFNLELSQGWKGAKLSQSEINRVIQSFNAAPK
jgi:hypothetical protein